MLDSSHIIIRSPRYADEEGLLTLVRESKDTLFPWVCPPDSKEAFKAYCGACISGKTRRGFFLFLRETEALVGIVNINEIVRASLQSGYLGYYIGSEYEGRGYMAQGMKLVIAHAFTKMKLHRLEANIQPSNIRSISLVRRLGFRQEGVAKRYLKIGGRWKDHLRWAITIEDWQTVRKSWRENKNRQKEI